MADIIVLIHFAFVMFVTLGGLLAIPWPRVVWIHIPAVIWGVWIELSGWICPLTPLENRLRHQQGLQGYEGDFVARYVLPILYPDGLTRQSQILLGTATLAINVAIYALIFLRHRRSTAKSI